MDNETRGQPADNGTQQTNTNYDSALHFLQAISPRMLEYLLIAYDAATNALNLAIFLFISITTLAAGFLTAIGIESISFVDKWSVLHTIVFYTATSSALLAPILAIPKVLLGHYKEKTRISNRTIAQHKIARHKIESDIGSTQKAIKTDKAKSEKLETDKNRSVWNLYKNRSLYPDKATIAQIEEKVAMFKKRIATNNSKILELDSKLQMHNSRTPAQPAPPSNIVRLSLFACYSTYSALALLVIIGLTDPFYAPFLAISLILLTILCYKTPLTASTPLISAYILCFGYFVGANAINLPQNVKLSIEKAAAQKVRILLSTGSGLIVVEGEGAEKQISFVPRETVTKATFSTTTKDNGILERLGIKRFCDYWINRFNVGI
jgi:hypothetical protein